jgi:hypothetical protein
VSLEGKGGYLVTDATDKNLVVGPNFSVNYVNVLYVGSGTPRIRLYDSGGTSGAAGAVLIFDTILTPTATHYRLDKLVGLGVAVKTEGSTTSPCVQIAIS